MQSFPIREVSFYLLLCASLGISGRTYAETNSHATQQESDGAQEVIKKDETGDAEPTLELPTPANKVKALRDEVWKLGSAVSKEKSEEIQSKLSEIHSQEIAKLPEAEREDYLKKLPYKEKENLQKTMDRNVEKLRSKAFGSGTEEAKKKYAEILKLQEAVEKVNFLPILGEMRKSYREERDRLEEKLQKGGTPKERAEYGELKNKIDAFNLIPIEEMQDLKRTKSPLFSGDKDPRSDKFIAENSDKVAAAQKEVAERLPSSLRDDFNKLFKPHAKFSEGIEPEIGFTPTDELLKRQLEERIAFGTKAYGDGHVSLERSGKLILPESAEESLAQLAGLKEAGLDKKPVSQLSDRSGIRSQAIEKTNDEFNAIGVILGAGALKKVFELGLKKAVVSGVNGGIGGVVLDGLVQQAEHVEKFIATGKWDGLGLDPTRSLVSLGAGVLLGPVVASNPGAAHLLGAMGGKEAVDNFLDGKYASALVVGGASLLAFRPKTQIQGDAIVGDGHLDVKKNTNGEFIIDTEKPSFRYLEMLAKDINSQKGQIGKIYLNGDMIDAPSFKASGAPATGEMKGKLNKAVADYLTEKTGIKVEMGEGNHDAIYNPGTGKYEGGAVAEALNKLGVKVITNSDVDTAVVNLTQKVDGKTVPAFLRHKITEFGGNLAELLPPSTIERVIPDVLASGNKQANSGVVAGFTSDIHQGASVYTPNNQVPGQVFVYANTGAVNGTQNAAVSTNGGKTFGEAGTYIVARPTKSGGINAEFRMLETGPGGGGSSLDPTTTQVLPWGAERGSPLQRIDPRLKLQGFTPDPALGPKNNAVIPYRIPSFSSGPSANQEMDNDTDEGAAALTLRNVRNSPVKKIILVQ